MARHDEPSSVPPSSRRRLALVVEDSVTERTLLAALAERHGLNAVLTSDAESALAAIDAQVPDLILLDVYLPSMDGLTLLSRIREEHPYVPVVVVSSTDDRQHTEEALNLGAANFLRKPIRSEEFRFVLDRIMRILEEEEDLQSALLSVLERRTELSVPGNLALIPRVVAFLGREVRQHYPGHRIPLPEIKLALLEAMANAVEHGNLEIGYAGKSEALSQADGLRDLIEIRQKQQPYADRRVHVTVVYRPDRAEYVVRDEGRGFDPGAYDPTCALADTNRLHGRGLALIHHYMDDVHWNAAGNEIRMVRHVGTASGDAAPAEAKER